MGTLRGPPSPGDHWESTRTSKAPSSRSRAAFFRRRAASESDVAPAASSEGSAIEGLLKSITGREAEVLRLRYGLYSGHAMTLDEIGKKLNLTRERIRQIQKRALRKLQEKMADARVD